MSQKRLLDVTSSKLFFCAGLNSAALESKIINGYGLPAKPKIYLASLRYEENEQWIRICSLQAIAATFFLTVGRCMQKLDEHGGIDKVRIFLGNPTDIKFQQFQIKIYQDYADYALRRKTYDRDHSMPYYGVTLLWVSEIWCYNSINHNEVLLKNKVN